MDDLRKFADKLITAINEIVAEERNKAGKLSVLKVVDNAVKVYAMETGEQPGVIIANVPAWEAMKAEADRIAPKDVIVGYTTFRGIRLYKADDGIQKPYIRLAKDVKTFEIETGASK